MKVSELGEFGLIDLLAKAVGTSSDKQLIIGIGDDAAAWRGDDSIQLATVDSFTEGVHFSLDTASWGELGWKALAVNLSDIAAMGGLPRYALVSLALPGDTEVEAVTALYKGMLELARPFDVTIIGGDTSSAALVAINITVLGRTQSPNKHILSRSAARPGDKVAVTGYLGTAAAGMRMLTGRLRFASEVTARLRGAFLRPTPRVAEGQLLVEQGVKTAIDVSDGLVSDMRQICKASSVGARIEVDSVPVLPEVRDGFGDGALELALAGGEDYELLFTGSTEVINGVKEQATCPVTVIGEITGKAGEVALIDSRGSPFSLPRGGWEHFVPKES
jgi:thiamine-monophosphate kinase